MKMTGAHVGQMEYAIEAAELEERAELSEILSVIKGLADGSLRCADSKTEVVVEREEIEAVRETARVYGQGTSSSYAAYAFTLITETVSRWLSTPEQPATERRT